MSQAKKLVASAMAAAGMVFAPSASALVTDWTAEFENGFAAGSSLNWLGVPVTQVPGSATTVGPNAAFSQIRWGPGGPSGLNVTPDSILGGPVPVVTNDPPVNTVQLTHLNRVIGCTRGNSDGTPSGSGPICLNALKDTTLLTQLTLTALNVDGMGGTAQETLPVIAIQIRFAETFNQTNNANCGFPEAAASAGCRDIFVVLNPGALVQEIPIDVGDGENYFLQIGAAGLGPLSNEACARAGVATDFLPADPLNSCIGLTTAEGGDRNILANIRIFTQDVPEPGTLAILALGLLAIGVVTRRKRA